MRGRSRRSPERVLRDLAEGRGAGRGEQYRSFFTVREFSSNGYSKRVFGHKSRRVQELVSNIEYAIFLLLDWNDRVVDILEQHVLHPDVTGPIASRLGYRHPKLSRSIPAPFTTDLVAVLDDKLKGDRIAVSCKPAVKLGNRRVLEKLEIERRAWESLGVPWFLATDREYTRAVKTNLEHLYRYRCLEGFDVPEPETAEAATEYLLDQLRTAPTLSFSRACKSVDERLHLPPRASMVLGWHAMATKRWQVDLTQRISGARPLPGLRRRTAITRKG